MKKTLSSLRVEEKTLSSMKQAIEKYNKQNLFKINESEFRRLSLEILSQLILLDKLQELNITLQNI